MDNLYFLFSNIYLLGIAALALAFIVSIKMFPAIICLSNEKNLMAVPGERSMHTKNTPNLGGVGIFIAFSIIIMVLGGLNDSIKPQLDQLLLLMAAVTIMFFLGVKDDLIGISPKKKFTGQGIASVLVVLMTDIRIHNFDGLLGIGELPYLFSIILTIVVFIFLINAFNLIDGIDGLAGSIAIIASLIFGLFFMVYGYYLLMLVSFILVGGLIGFLCYNFSEKHKVFMGDSGSLFVGFLLAYQAIGFLGIDTSGSVLWALPNKAVLVMAILSFPMLDTLRVFIIRIRQGRSPFSADRNHIHHRLIDLGLSHKQGTLLLTSANVFIVLLTFVMGDINVNSQLFIISIVVPCLGLLPWIMAREKGRIILHAPRLSLAMSYFF